MPFCLVCITIAAASGGIVISILAEKYLHGVIDMENVLWLYEIYKISQVGILQPAGMNSSAMVVCFCV